jgi:hypothetical protein
MDGDRFSTEPHHAWQAQAGDRTAWWQVQFDPPRPIGAILQINGDHPFVLHNAPRRYVWQTSLDGVTWRTLQETSITNESRLYRLHRLGSADLARFLRTEITETSGTAPTLREVEVFESTTAHVAFPEWIVAVNTTDQPVLPGHGQEFIPLARACPGWEGVQAQQIWLSDFNEKFAEVEPRPLCAFLSGNFKDWCQIDREPWRGTQELLRRGDLPMWASCGGAQGLAILAETGVDQPWDCPHCRDPRAPKTPIYTHIGHTGSRPCGDYSGCIFERGAHLVKPLVPDPVFSGLGDEFNVMESHCGQIEWAPRGWELIATAGKGTLTKVQCLRQRDHCIYAAQFHIEMQGTPETSRRIMSNFLSEAKRAMAAGR